MLRISHYLPRVCQAGLSRPVASLTLTSKFPRASVSNARFASSGQPSTQHMADAVANVASKNTRIELTPDQKWAVRSKTALADAMADPPADAYAGRSVKNTGNLAQTFRLLQDVLTRNKVKQTVRMTERHEKKGAKRRRLQSERWRKAFADEVRKKVQLVIKIRNRGA